jgi:hypothetical protein
MRISGISDSYEQRYHLPGGETLLVGQPFFDIGPGLRLHWSDAAPGHELLNELLGCLFVLELDQPALAAASGGDCAVAPLRELAERPGWLLRSRLAGDIDRYRLTRTDSGQSEEGDRFELLLTLELATRLALQSIAGQTPPAWALRARQAHRALQQALQGHALFRPE